MKVKDLTEGMLFTLPCESNRTIYRFVKNEFIENRLDASVIIGIAGFWPDEARGKGIPAHYCRSKQGESSCNPYAEARLVTCNG